jgi:hypothetical protein
MLQTPAVNASPVTAERDVGMVYRGRTDGREWG